MWDRFSERLKRAIKHAVELAQEMGADSVEPRHLLIGLLSDSENLAYRMISRAGVAPEKIARYAGAELVRRPDGPENISFSESSKLMLEQSYKHARQLRHSHIGTGHMLLAIASGIGTPLGLMLRGFDIDFQQLRALLADESHGEEEGTSPPRRVPMVVQPRLTRAIALAKCAEITTLMSYIEFGEFQRQPMWAHRCQMTLRELLSFMPQGPEELLVKLQQVCPVDLRSLERLLGGQSVVAPEDFLWRLATEVVPAWSAILEEDLRAMPTEP